MSTVADISAFPWWKCPQNSQTSHLTLSLLQPRQLQLLWPTSTYFRLLSNLLHRFKVLTAVIDHLEDLFSV